MLHYINNDGELRDGELLLIDAGAEYKGYASDITRTFPNQRPVHKASARNLRSGAESANVLCGDGPARHDA